MSKFSDISDTEFKIIVEQNKTIRDVVGALGYSRSSGSMGKLVKDRIVRLNIDTSHFKRYDYNKLSQPKYALEDILIENSKYENMRSLKKRLINAGLLEYKCANCGNIGIWNNRPLTLQIEHKNGIHSDNRIENLCFLCPNCHSQTDTFGGKNIKK